MLGIYLCIETENYLDSFHIKNFEQENFEIYFLYYKFIGKTLYEIY